MYGCMTCVEVDFCEQCFAALLGPGGHPKSIYIRDPAYEFLCLPLRDWAIAEGIMLFGEGKDGDKRTRQVKVTDWLNQVEKDWKARMAAGV
jgi:hypothetical protein